MTQKELAPKQKLGSENSFLWLVSAIIVAIWFVLKFVLHKGGYVHILLLLGISIFVVQVVAYRKAQYHRLDADGNG